MKQFNHIRILIIIFTFSFLLLNLSAPPAQAQAHDSAEIILTQGSETTLPVIASARYLVQVNTGNEPTGVNTGEENTPPRLSDPLGGRRTVPQIIGDAIKVALGIVGSIALALFVYGGFMWMTAGGNAQRVSKGRDVLIWSAIGLLVVFTSYAVLQFVISAIRGT